MSSVGKQWQGMFAVVLTAALLFGLLPGAHSHASPMPQSSQAEQLMHADMDHSHHAAPTMDMAAEPDGMICCEDAGLCAAAHTLFLEGAELELAFRQIEDWVTRPIALAHFDPALDIPPPRRT